MAGGKRRNEQRQVAALPLRLGRSGAIEVLLVTSRRTNRWVLPKGNLMKGVSDARAAAIEAREEAGVEGRVRKQPLGHYVYWKRRMLSFELFHVDVFPMAVTREDSAWKEKGERERNWVSLPLATRMVLEPGLQSILRDLADDTSLVTLLGVAHDGEVPRWKGFHAA